MKKKLLSLLLALTTLAGVICLPACTQAFTDITHPFNNDPEPPAPEQALPTAPIAEAPWGSIELAAASHAQVNKRNELLTPENNDYLSRTAVTYEGVNGKPVTVYSLMIDVNGAFYNHPNFAQIVMLYQCIRYKDAHPEEAVQITLTSFHLSVYLAGCVDPTSPDYGRVMNLFDADYNDQGYYRLSYLLVEAAKKGIDVTVIGQIDAAGTDQTDGTHRPDASFDAYFTAALSQDAYIAGKKVSDFMTFRVARWLSYGDKAAADMMHNKTCTVSHYIDNNGVEHRDALWVGSINLDGISGYGYNGNNSVQTGMVVANHGEMRRVMVNYTKLMADYCKQEEITLFREAVISATTKQMELLNAGRGSEIPADKQIVYPGTAEDKVFELYFTPFGGDFSTWDTTYNPYAKYLSKLLEAASGKDYLELIWNNVKYDQDFELSKTLIEVVKTAFLTSGNTQNRLALHLPGLDGAAFSSLQAGQNIGYTAINAYTVYYHTKDLQLSYVEDGQRYYVSLFNSLNFHEGSMYHQTNTVLVVKETAATGNDLYIDYAILTTPGMDFESYRVKAAE